MAPRELAKPSRATRMRDRLGKGVQGFLALVRTDSSVQTATYNMCACTLLRPTCGRQEAPARLVLKVMHLLVEDIQLHIYIGAGATGRQKGRPAGPK